MLIRCLLILSCLLWPISTLAATQIDDFTSASSVELSTHTATPSTGTWTKVVGAATWTVNSGDFLTFTNSDSTLIIYTLSWTPAAANYDISWLWKAESTGASPADDVTAIVARYTDTNNYYYAAFKRGAETPDTYIGKFVAGVRTDIVSGDCGQVNGDILKFVVTDGEKKIQVNGADCSGLTTSDNALTSAGSVGIGCGTIITTANQDCAVTVQVDDFTLVDISISNPRNLMLMGVGP